MEPPDFSNTPDLNAAAPGIHSAPAPPAQIPEPTIHRSSADPAQTMVDASHRISEVEHGLGHPLHPDDRAAIIRAAVNRAQSTPVVGDQTYQQVGEQQMQGHPVANAVDAAGRAVLESGSDYLQLAQLPGSPLMGLGPHPGSAGAAAEARQAAQSIPTEESALSAKIGRGVEAGLENAPFLVGGGAGGARAARMLPEVFGVQGEVKGVGGSLGASEDAGITGAEKAKRAIGQGVIGYAAGAVGGKVLGDIPEVITANGLTGAVARVGANAVTGGGIGGSTQAGSNIINERPIGEGVVAATAGGAVQQGIYGATGEVGTTIQNRADLKASQSRIASEISREEAALDRGDEARTPPVSEPQQPSPPQAPAAIRGKTEQTPVAEPTAPKAQPEPTAPGRTDPTTLSYPDLREYARSRGINPNLPGGAQKSKAQLIEALGGPKAAPPKPPPKPTAANQAGELMNQLRDAIVNEHGPGVSDLPNQHPIRLQALRGDVRRGSLVSPELAVELAQRLPADHPARMILHNIEQAKQFPHGTKVEAVNSAQEPDGTRVQIGPNETVTFDKELGEVKDGIKTSLPDEGMTLIGKKLPPIEPEVDLGGGFIPPEEAHAAMTESGVKPERAAESVRSIYPESEVSNAAPSRNQPTGVSQERGNIAQGGAPAVGGAENRPQPAPSFGDQSETGIFGNRIITPTGVGEQKPLFHEPVNVEVPREKPVGSAEANKPENTGKLFPRSGGFVGLPDVAEASKRGLGVVRRIRERFSEIAAKDSEPLARALTDRVTSYEQAKSIVRDFIARTFGSNDKAMSDFVTLGYDFRRELLNARGQAASNLPRLSAADRALMMANPVVQDAIKLWNREIRPVIDSIRTTHGMPMDPNAGKVPFFLNLVTESDPATGGYSATTYGKAFSKPASGESEYTNDPREALERIVGGHLRSDASAAVSREVNRISIDPLKVTDPLGKRSPASFQKADIGRPFEAQVKGRTEQVGVVDLNEGKSGKGGNPLPPDYRYVPLRVAKEVNNIHQASADYDTIIDKVIRGFTRVGLIGDLAPHSIRVLANTSARLAQSGYSPASMLPSWLGSIPSTIRRMGQMSKSRYGQAIQLLVDQSGAAREAGYGIEPAKTTADRILNIPHDLLMNPDYGIDPMARRTVADAHLRMLFGNEVMNRLEQRVNGGHITTLEMRDGMNKLLDADQMLALGRRVNATLGFYNRQTRSNLLNWMQRAAPFIGSESGMIPDELRRLLTLNLNPPAVARNVSRGAYGRAALQTAGMLAGGAVGVQLLKHALNYATTAAFDGKGRFMDQNDEAHKDDVYIGGKWYWTNLDPGLARASRISGEKARLNQETPHRGTELVNEGLSTMSSGLRIGFSLLTGYEPYLLPGGKLMKGRSPWPVGVGRQSAQAVASGKGIGPAMAQDAASIFGIRLQPGGRPSKSPAEHAALDLQQKLPDRDPQQQAAHEQRTALLDALRAHPDQSVKILSDAVRSGKLEQREISSLRNEANRSPIENAVADLPVDKALQWWKDERVTDVDREPMKAEMQNKILRSGKSDDEQDRMFKETGITPPADLLLLREKREIEAKAKLPSLLTGETASAEGLKKMQRATADEAITPRELARWRMLGRFSERRAKILRGGGDEDQRKLVDGLARQFTD